MKAYGHSNYGVFPPLYSECHQLCCCAVCADCWLGCSTNLFGGGGGYTGCLSPVYLDSKFVDSKGYINHWCPKTVQVDMTVEQKQTSQQGHPISNGICPYVQTGWQFPGFSYLWNRPIKCIPYSFYIVNLHTLLLSFCCPCFHDIYIYINYTSVAPHLFTVCHFSSSYLAVRGKYKSKAFKRPIITKILSTMV